MALDLPATLARRADALQLWTQGRSGDAAVLLASAEQWAKRKSDLDLLFEMLLSLVRDVAVSRAGGKETLLMHADIRESTVTPGSRGAIRHTVGSVRDRPLDSGNHRAQCQSTARLRGDALQDRRRV